MFTLNKVVTALALCSTLALSSYAIAKPEQGANKQKMKCMFAALSVTDTQKQDIRQIMKQARGDRDISKADMKSFKQEFNALVRAESWDAEAVETLLTGKQSQKAEAGLRKAQNKHAIWNVLTPEQQAEFANIMAERKAKADESKQNRKGKKGKKRKMAKRLGLDEAQKAEMASIKSQAKEGASELKANLKSFKQAERALIQSGEFNADAWTSLHSQYQNDFLAAALIKTKAKHDSWNVLTPEQQAKAAAKNAKEKKRADKKGSKGERKNKQKREG